MFDGVGHGPAATFLRLAPAAVERGVGASRRGYWRALWRIEALFLSKEDCDALELSLEDMLAAVEMGLDAHGRNDVLLPSVAGLRPGRESDRERILFRHKGFAISDIVLGHLAFEKAKERGVGTTLPYYAPPRDE